MCLGTKSYWTFQTIQTTNLNDQLHAAKFQQGNKVVKKEPDFCYKNIYINVKLKNKNTPWIFPFLQMLSRNKIYSLSEIQYNEAKFQLVPKIFVPKQLKAPKKHKANKFCCYQTSEMKVRRKSCLWHTFV